MTHEPTSRPRDLVAWTQPREVHVPWVAIVALSAIAAALTLVLPSTNGYDPWSWLIWGREITQGALVTFTGPSWKPLPVLITTPLSLAGDAAPDLWLAFGWAGAAAALVPAARLGGRMAGTAGALLAAVFLLLASWWLISVGLGFSEGLMIWFVLAATERALADRPGQAFAFGLLAALLRPEAWPFLGAYALFVVARDRRRLAWVTPGLLILPLLWFVPEHVGSGDFSRAADRAQVVGPDSPALADRPALAVIESVRDNLAFGVEAALLLALAAAVARTVPAGALRPAAVVGALGVAWLALVCVMAEAGFSGILRYVMVPMAFAHVLAAAGVVWWVRHVGTRWSGAPRALAIGAVVALPVVGLGADAPRAFEEAATVVRYEEQVNDDLPVALRRAGGPDRVMRCGDVFTPYHAGPMVAWTLKRHIHEVDFKPRPPGAVLRTSLPRSGPVLRPERPLESAPGRRVLAQTARWRIVEACPDR